MEQIPAHLPDQDAVEINLYRLLEFISKNFTTDPIDPTLFKVGNSTEINKETSGKRKLNLYRALKQH